MPQDKPRQGERWALIDPLPKAQDIENAINRFSSREPIDFDTFASRHSCVVTIVEELQEGLVTLRYSKEVQRTWKTARVLQSYMYFPPIAPGTKYQARKDTSRIVEVLADNTKGISYSSQDQPNNYFKASPENFWVLFGPGSVAPKDIWDRLVEDTHL